MNREIIKLKFLLLLLFFIIQPHISFALQVTNLRCNAASDPISIDDIHPRLSWQLISANRGAIQTAFRIIVSSSSKKLDMDIGDIWDSKKVNSDQSLFIVYRGKTLLSTRTYYWKVKIWDERGRASVWSEAANWRMGLLHPEEWKAKWITASKWFTAPQYRPKGLKLSGNGGWADIDLGKSTLIQRLKLFPFDAASFPLSYKILGANEFNFIHSTVLVDESDSEDIGQVNSPLEFIIKPIKCRYIRLQILPNKQEKSSIVRQIEIFSGDKNVALMKFTREYGTAWDDGHAPFVVDGMPSKNEGDVCPADACPSTAAPQFRKSFNIRKKVAKATIYFAALGFVDITLNGQKVTEDLLGPPFTDYSKRIMYVAYDVTSSIKNGSNTLGALLGNGFFSTPLLGFGQRQNGNGPPRFLVQTLIEYLDGSREWVCTDNTWKWTRSEITFNDVWEGYAEDRNLAKSGWRLPAYDDTAWFKVTVIDKLPGKLEARIGPPNRINKIIKPVKVKNEHAYFNTVSVGWPVLKLNGKAGQHITITGSGPGYNTAKLSYILAEDGPTTLAPNFIIQPGATDIKVDGLESPLNLDDITIQYINADLKEDGVFSCSNPYLNKLFKVAMHTHRNYVNDFPADPNREKQGWTQDVQNMFHTAAYFTDVKDLYKRWWNDMSDSQDEQGYLGSVVPMVNRQVYDWNSPWWSGMIVFLPWEHYQYYGDKEILDNSYAAMRKYVDLLGKIASTGEGKNWNDYPYFTKDLDTIAAKEKMIIWNGAGDWNNPFTNTQHAVPTPMTTMPAWYHFANIVSKTAALLGKKHDAIRYAAIANDVKARFNRKYFHPATGLYGDSVNSQTGQILPLAVGMVPDKQKTKAYARLIDAIHLRKDHIGTGFISIDFLLQKLASERESVLANKIINQLDYPSWNTLIKNDVLQENWHGGGAQMPSCGGAIGAWLFQSVLGIQPDAKQPGFKHFFLSPQPDKGTGLTSASGFYRSPYGVISMSWKCVNNKFLADIIIPPNTSAKVIIPADNRASFRESGKAKLDMKNIRHINFSKKLITCEIKAGKFHLETDYSMGFLH